ncbi:hypothetical protein [uncultured Gemmiger sp.]|uniref:hypothetical protein n=1 Tax=uncultured Gemmiger sp. TaxID=1623490 RepID=UPI0025ECD116|nr:hypothetical protein [uncultured Gemmiger sp.]
MQNKLRRILQKQDGIAILLVLCLGALFVALAAALGYAASVLTANANSQLREQQTYQLAVSFSDVLEKELNKDSEFATFINDTYMNSVAYGTNIYTQESGKTVMNGSAAATNAAEADKLTLTLQRRPGTEADDLTAGVSIPYSNADDLATTLSDMESLTHTVKDLELDITVKAEKDGVSYAYTVNYVRSAHYDVLYYTLNNDDTTHYTWDTTNKTFSAGSTTVTVNDTNNPQVTLHYDTTQKPTGVTYTRGLRSQKGAT